MSQTYGSYAGELMAAAGKSLFFWQQQSVNAMMAYERESMLWLHAVWSEICTRQNGKGVIGEARVSTGFLLLKEKLQLWSAHQGKTITEAFERFTVLLTDLSTYADDQLIILSQDIVRTKDDGPVRIKISNTNGKEGFTRMDTRQRILFSCRSNHAGRGFTVDGALVVDETYDYTPEQAAAQAPLQLQVPNGQQLNLSSPPLTGDTGEVLYSLRDQAEELIRQLEAGQRPRIEVGYRDWGLAAELEDHKKFDKDDPHLWAQTNPGYLTQYSHRSMVITRNKMKARDGIEFARECLGMWPRRKTAGGAIDIKKWMEMKDPESTRDPEVGVAIGVHIEPDRKWSQLALWSRREDGKGHVQMLSVMRGTDRLITRMKEIRADLGPFAFSMLQTVYDSIRVELTDAGFELPRDEELPEWGDLYVMPSKDSAAACGAMLDAIDRVDFRYHENDDLQASAEAARLKRSQTAVVWAQGDNEDETGAGPIQSVTNARWCFMNLIDKVTSDGPQIW